jgi:hypothetical protein
MAVQYANIMQSLNMMLESRERREQAEEQAALQGLRLAQQDKQFQQEYALKQQAFQMEQKKFFIEQGLMLQKQADDFAAKAGLALIRTEFIPLVEAYMEPGKKEGEFSLKGLQSGGTSDLSKVLQSTYGMPAEKSVVLANNLASLYLNAEPDMGTLENTLAIYEDYTGTKLKNANDFRLYRNRWRELGEELDDIRNNDYVFDKKYGAIETTGLSSRQTKDLPLEPSEFSEPLETPIVFDFSVDGIEFAKNQYYDEYGVYADEQGATEYIFNAYKDNTDLNKTISGFNLSEPFGSYKNRYTSKENLSTIRDVKKAHQEDYKIAKQEFKDSKEGLRKLNGLIEERKKSIGFYSNNDFDNSYRVNAEKELKELEALRVLYKLAVKDSEEEKNKKLDKISKIDRKQFDDEVDMPFMYGLY